MAPVLVWHVSFFMALVLQLQLWHLQWLVSIHAEGKLHSYTLRALHFMSHGDAVPSLDDNDQDNIAHIPVQQYQLGYHGFRQLGACHCVHHVGIVEKCVTPFGGNFSETTLSGHMLYNIFDLFLTRNHTMETFCLNFLSLCPLIKCRIFSNTLQKIICLHFRYIYISYLTLQHVLCFSASKMEMHMVYKYSSQQHSNNSHSEYTYRKFITFCSSIAST
jgi:hypothetical protein